MGVQGPHDIYDLCDSVNVSIQRPAGHPKTAIAVFEIQYQPTGTGTMLTYRSDPGESLLLAFDEIVSSIESGKVHDDILATATTRISRPCPSGIVAFRRRVGIAYVDALLLLSLVALNDAITVSAGLSLDF